jgi:hypothetical protein
LSQLFDGGRVDTDGGGHMNDLDVPAL